MRACAVALFGLLGCGRVHFDARTDAAGAAAVDAPFPTGPFGQAVPISELNSPDVDDDPSMTGDLLEIYFVSNRVTNDQLHVAVRESIDAPWSAPVPVAVGGSANNAKVLPDGLTLYFASSRMPNAGMADLWYVTRPDRASPWGTPQPVPGLATPSDEFEPSATPDQLTLVFTATGSPTLADPYITSRSSTAEPFANRQPVPELASDEYDGGYFLTADRLLVLFHSDRGPSRDLWQATRTSVDEAFAPPVRIAELNSTLADSDPWLSPDGHTIVFSRDIGGDNDELFIATR